MKTARHGLLAFMLLAALHSASAGLLRDRIMERRAQHEQQQEADEMDDGSTGAAASMPAGVRVLRDISYGSAPLQRFDVWLPAQVKPGAPVIFMVHGGGWRRGDKHMATVVDNKVARWVPRGFIFISTNYRMLPGTGPIDQARDVALALATAQQKAASWSGDASKFIVMGHSAGAHLVALLGVSPDMVVAAGARPWLATIPLDSAALDVPQIMEKRHMRLYDPAFGKDLTTRQQLLYRGGLTITTTLVPAEQALAVKAVDDKVPPTDPSGVGAAISVVEPGTGKITAMAQNRDYSAVQNAGPGQTSVNWNTGGNYGGSNGFAPGSSFKPFTLVEWLKTGHNLMQTFDGTLRPLPLSSFTACGLPRNSWMSWMSRP